MAKLKSPGPRAIGWASPAVTAWMRQQLVAAGSDPTVIPDEPVRFMRPAEVQRVTGLSRTTLWRRIQAGEFPKGVPLRGPQS